MKNLLFISSYPLPLDKGSNQHAYYFLKALASHFNVYCIFFFQPEYPSPDLDDTSLSDIGIKGYTICHFSQPKKSGKLMSNLNRLLSFPSPYMNRATNQDSYKKIKEFIDQYSIEIVHIEHFHYAKYAFLVSPLIIKVIVYHDLYHSIYRQKIHYEKKIKNKFMLFTGFIKYLLFEKQIDKYVDAKVFLNADEMASLPKKAFHIPHIVNQKIVFNEPQKKELINILFLGTYNHPPNRLSIQYIIEQILPELADRSNKFKFHIFGSGTEVFKKLVINSPIRHLINFHGYVEDINKVFYHMDIALFPILYGGGIKTKVLDAMAAGVPIITTPNGIFGLNNLPDDCISVGRTNSEIIEQTLTLIKGYQLRLTRAINSKGYLDSEHSYKIFSKRIIDIYTNKIEDIN